MKIIYPERIEEFADLHPDAKAALERWSAVVKAATWKHHADLKKDFPSADYVGNNRYVFNIKGITIERWLCLYSLQEPWLSVSLAPIRSTTRLRT